MNRDERLYVRKEFRRWHRLVTRNRCLTCANEIVRIAAAHGVKAGTKAARELVCWNCHPRKDPPR